MSYKPTVMPKDESLSRQDNNLGAPGIQLPQNPSEIKEFSEVSNVDAKDLNAKLQALDEARANPSTGIAIPKDAENIKEFSEVRDIDAKDLNAKLQK